MAEDGNPEGVVPADGDHAPVTDSAGAGMHPHDPEHMPDDDLNADYMLGEYMHSKAQLPPPSSSSSPPLLLPSSPPRA